MKKKKKNLGKEIQTEYIKKFWVGLMDGNGNIQVNHWRKKMLQYRLEIKLKNSLENFNMLSLITDKIGGYLKIIKKKEFLIWICDNKIEIKKIIKIFLNYPLLTIRKQKQLNFLNLNLEKNDIIWYLQNRNKKYLLKDYFNQSNIENISYFNEWLSGFVEAIGYFSTRQSNNSFSLRQKYEKELLVQIKNKFEITTKLRELKNDIYIIKVYKKTTLIKLLEHFTLYPLIGEKLNSYLNFKIIFEKK